MARASRTLNPLHFEDLEPHRFEDLVRQLAYEYRTWASIEATGRGGADDGIDIRAFEGKPDPEPQEDEEEAPPPPIPSGRLWVFQCKRERRITPRQVERYVQESVGGAQVPYGFILAAACDFSKKSYDAFRTALIGTGVQEFHLWGKAELEDMLFQPKNDHLLFAYFGISLQTRKRSRQSELRATLAMRKRVGKLLGSVTRQVRQEVLLRSVDDEYYPVIEEAPEFERTRPWGIYLARSLNSRNNIIFDTRRRLAYGNPETQEWDVLEEADVRVTHQELYGQRSTRYDPLRARRREAWAAFVPAPYRAELVQCQALPLSAVVGVDEEGDVVHPLPTLFVEPLPSGLLFDSRDGRDLIELVSGGGSRSSWPCDPAKRIPFFRDFKLEDLKGEEHPSS